MRRATGPVLKGIVQVQDTTNNLLGDGVAPSDMSGTYVVVRLPSKGTLFGDAMAGHPGARITSVPAGRREGTAGSMTDLVALVEGLPDSALASILLAWNRRYGEPADIIGETFALRLPLNVEEVPTPASEILRMGEHLPVFGNVAQDDWMEQWLHCGSDREAEALAARMRAGLGEGAHVSIRTAEPRRQDSECWELLRFAAGQPEIPA
jgi:hypothetical protein